MHDLVTKWVSALRSGEYVQGRHGLRVGDGDEAPTFCCMGVLCDISGIGDWAKDGRAWRYGTGLPDSDARNSGYPPKPVKELIGLERDFESHLATLNDQFGESFEKIAKAIEEEFASRGPLSV